MRTISSSFTNIAQSKARVVSAYAVVKDHRIRFYNLNKLSADSALYSSNFKSHDSDAYSGGIYRVANVNNQLYFQYLGSPGGSWPGWTNSGRSLKANSRPGIYQNCVWYQDTSGNVVKAYLNGSSIGSASSVYTGLSGICALAPISTTEAVCREAFSGENYAKVSWMVDQPGIGLNYAWEGRIFKNNIANVTIEEELFDAEKDPSTGWTHVFWSDSEVGRVKTFRFLGLGHKGSSIEGVIPMDVVDDLNTFIMGGVSRGPSSSTSTVKPPSHAGDLWIGGALVRSDGGHMQMYSQGPPWTHGRDIFAGTDGTEARTYGGNPVPVAGGKFHFVGSNVYYIGPGVAYQASGVDWTDDGSPSYTLDEIMSFNVTQGQNAPARLTMEIASSITSSVLRKGSDIELYAQLSTEGGATYSGLVGTFNIDVILGGEDTAGEYKTVIARSSSGKALSMWSPDTSFDYWGPDKKVALPEKQTELIRIDGNIISSGSYITAESLNDRQIVSPPAYWNNGHMYSLARPSRGGIAKTRFKYDSANLYDPQVGITLNLYKETEEEALARIDPNELRYYGGTVPPWWYGTNLIAVTWGTREHSGSPGVSVKWVLDSDWDATIYSDSAILGTHALNIPSGTYYWLMTSFYEGVLKIYYRADTSTTWTLLATYTLQNQAPNSTPWYRDDQKGRFGLYLYNETPYVGSYPLQSDAEYLPFASKTDQYGRTFPTPGEYVVDSEHFYVNTIVGGSSFLMNLLSQKGYVWPGTNQPWENTYQGPYTGNPIWFEWIGSVASTAHTNFNGMVIQMPSGKQYVISDWDWKAPTQWVPNTYPTYNDNWMDFVGNGAYGSWSGTRSRFFVTEEARYVPENKTCYVLYAGDCTRGYNDTVQTSHGSGGKISYYTPNRLKVDRYHAFTSEREWSMADMMTETARKAGVIDIIPKNHLSYTSSLTRSSTGWAVDSQCSSYGIRQANVVAHCKVVSGSEYGIQFGREPTWSGGYMITYEPGAAKINLRYADSTTLIESIPIGSSNNGWLTFSVQKDVARAYINGQLVAAFQLPGEISTQGWAAPVYRGSTVYYDWPELSMRVDNFIMDIGKRGNAIFQQLIGQKRLYWQDDQYGRLRIYRDRVTVNSSSSPWDMTIQSGYSDSETDMATRIRVEGLEAWQSLDEDAMREHGSIFRVFNNEDVENQQDAAVEADFWIEETARMSDKVQLTGSADLRVEAGDEFWVNLPSGVKKVIVEEVQISMRLSNQSVIFDMQIGGYYA